MGAGLPVLSTLQSMIKTGDKLGRIEGVFSGTLSFIFNSFGPRTPFSEVVSKAKAAGYTEPDPRDDLSGASAVCILNVLIQNVLVHFFAHRCSQHLLDAYLPFHRT